MQKFDLEYKNKYYEDNFEFDSNSTASYENQEISLFQFEQTNYIDFKKSEEIFEVVQLMHQILDVAIMKYTPKIFQI